MFCFLSSLPLLFPATTAESIATLPPFGPIDWQKWFFKISSQWESQKIQFALISFGKIHFSRFSENTKFHIIKNFPEHSFFGPPRSGTGFISQRYGSGSGSGSFPFLKIMLAKTTFNTKIQQKINFFRLKIMCLRVSCKKQKSIFLSCLKSLKKGVGSGSIVRGTDTHQNVTDPQQCKKTKKNLYLFKFPLLLLILCGGRGWRSGSRSGWAS